jgi:DNA adenine methylase
VKVRSPLAWLGSKARYTSKIIGLFPPHHSYVEVFGGSGAVLLAKEPSKVEVFNDVDDSLINLFRVLRDPRLSRKLQRACEATLYSRSEFNLAQEPTDDPVEKARRFLVRYRMSWSGLGVKWSYSVTASSGGMASVVGVWRSTVEGLGQVHERLRRVQIEQADWREVLQRYDGPGTLHYIDPPYVQATRVSGQYPCEMTRGDHDDLVQRVLCMKGMVVLSGYQHPSYRPLESCGWVNLSYGAPAYTSDTRSRRVEQLWLSPSVLDKNPSVVDRMRSGAYQTHLARAKNREAILLSAIRRLETKGERVTIAAAASMSRVSHEHVSRRYSHLFP